MLSIPWHVRWHNGCTAQRVWWDPLSRTRMGSIGVATRSTGGHKRLKAKRAPKLKVKGVQGKNDDRKRYSRNQETFSMFKPTN